MKFGAVEFCSVRYKDLIVTVFRMCGTDIWVEIPFKVPLLGLLSHSIGIPSWPTVD
jgi:hypothetical protein